MLKTGMISTACRLAYVALLVTILAPTAIQAFSVAHNVKLPGGARGAVPSTYRTQPLKRSVLSVKASSSSFDGTGKVPMAAKVQKLAQTAAGAALTFGLERGIAMTLAKAGLRLPSAPIGMLLVFAAMAITRAISEKATNNVLEFFGPCRDFYKTWVPLFFSVPLVDLPLSFMPIARMNIVKILAVIVSGTLFTLLAAFTIVSSLRGTAPIPQTAAVQTTTLSKTPSSLPFTLGALAVAAVGFASGVPMVGVMAVSVAGLQIGKSLPLGVRSVIPPIVTAAFLAGLMMCSLGIYQGVGWMGGLSQYRSLGGSLLLAQAAPSVVALGFGLFEQRSLIKRFFIPIAGGSALTSVCSIAFTVFIARVLQLPTTLALGVIPRTITLPIALPIAEILGGNTAVAAASVVLEGIIGSNFAPRILTKMGARDPVIRGVSIGASSHALGTAFASAQEPESAPSSAVTFLLSGSFSALLVNITPIRQLILRASGVM